MRDKVSELGAETVAAFLCEPVQGSGGVIVPPQGWLRAMCEACRDLDILFIADEVITGFEPFVETKYFGQNNLGPLKSTQPEFRNTGT